MKIEFHPDVLKQLQRLPRPIFGRALHQVIDLGATPRPPGAIKLAGSHGDYRVRIGEYHIVYTIDEPGNTLTVLRVGHRRDVYES